MLSLRSDAILKHQIMIWVYFLIGLKVDWLSNSKHPLFYLKIQPGEPLPFLNCFANWLLGKVIASHPGDTALFCCGRGGRWGGGAGFALGQLPLQEPSFLPRTEQAMHVHFGICALISMSRLPERTPLCDHWLLFWPPPREKGWGCCPELRRPRRTSQAQCFCCTCQANRQFKTLKYILFPSDPMDRIFPPHLLIRASLSIVPWLFVCSLLDPPLPSSSVLQRTDPCTLFAGSFANLLRKRFGQLEAPGETGRKWVELVSWASITKCHKLSSGS